MGFPKGIHLPRHRSRSGSKSSSSSFSIFRVCPVRRVNIFLVLVAVLAGVAQSVQVTTSWRGSSTEDHAGNAQVAVGLFPINSLQVEDQAAAEKKAAAAAHSPKTTFFLVAVGGLCSASLLLYLVSNFKGDTEDVKEEQEHKEGNNAEAGSPHSPSHRAQDDSALSSPTNRGARTRLNRRQTVIVAELKSQHWTIDQGNETMSTSMFVVNMFADLGPPGFLPLAAGLRNTGYIPGLLMLVLFYGVCVYTMYAIGRTTELSGAKDFAGQWRSTLGPKFAFVPVVVVVTVCFGVNISYSCFFADILSGVLPAMGLDLSRTSALIAFTAFPTLPLCLLKNLSALANSSFVAVVAVFYTAVFMVLRALDGSYQVGGRYFDQLPEAPKVPPASAHLWAVGMPSLVLLNGLALAFISHYNGCKYYRELQGHTPSRFVKCTAFAMGCCGLLFAITMIAGFHTFGSTTNSVILENYAEEDELANVARLGIGFSIIASFPLMFSGLREAVIALVKEVVPTSDIDLIWKQDILSLFLLALITFVAAIVEDAGLVVGIVGALCGSAIIYMVPCSLYTAAVKRFSTGSPGVVALNECLILLGAILAVAGTMTTLVF